MLPELTGPYYAELLMGFETRAAELGQSVMLMLAGGKADRARAVRQLATRVDGIAVLGSGTPPTVGRMHGQAGRHHRRRTPAHGIEAIARRERRERPRS